MILTFPQMHNFLQEGVGGKGGGVMEGEETKGGRGGVGLR